MPRGGHRPGAGRPRGRLNNDTVTQRIAEEQYRAFMLREKEALWLAQRERALGAYVLMVQTTAGPERVTDPERIARVMASPATRGADYWWIEAERPDAVLIREINNRLMGVPAQVHAVSTTHSLADILSGLGPPEA